MNDATAWWRELFGTPAPPIQRRIELANMLLAAWLPGTAPSQRLGILFQLGRDLTLAPGDDVETSLRRALALLTEVLRATERSATPAQRFAILAAVGACARRSVGFLDGAAEIAIGKLEEALLGFEGERDIAWAIAADDLGRAYLLRRPESEDGDVARAIEVLTESATVFKAHGASDLARGALVELADAWSRVPEIGSEALRMAGSTLYAALETGEPDADEAARIGARLGRALLELSLDAAKNAASDAEEAVVNVSLEQALAYLDSESNPGPWLLATLTLAERLSQDAALERSESDERAIALFEAIRAFETDADTPEQHKILEDFRLRANLGLSGLYLRPSARTGTNDVALAAERLAEAEASAHADPARPPDPNLAALLKFARADLIVADPSRDQVEAVAAALDILEPALATARLDQLDPTAVAAVLGNLAVLLTKYEGPFDPNAAERALELTRRALEALPHERSAAQRAGLLGSLADILVWRFDILVDRGQAEADLEEAIRACEDARAALPEPPPARIAWAIGLTLGMAWWRRRLGDHSTNLSKGIAVTRSLLDGPLDANSEWRADAEQNLGLMLDEAGDYAGAADAFAAALRGRPVERDPRKHAISQASLGELRGREGDWLAAADALRAALDASEAARAASTSEVGRHAELRKLGRYALKAAFAEGQAGRGEEAVEALERGVGLAIKSALAEAGGPTRVDSSDVAAAAARIGMPIAYLLCDNWGSLALLVQPDDPQVRIVPLPGVTLADLNRILFDIDDEPGYLRAVSGNDPVLLRGVLDRFWSGPAWRLLRPVARGLRAAGHHQALLVPTGLLTALPIASLASHLFEASWAPSAGILRRPEPAAAPSPGRRLLGVADTRPQTEPLPFALGEMRAVAGECGDAAAVLFTGHEASAERVLAALPAATHMHFACHAYFELARPLRSELRMAGSSAISAEALLAADTGLAGTELVVLSACTTAFPDLFDAPEQAVSLATIFLRRGVPAVIAALWPVNDASTAALMKEFYRRYVRLGEPPARALRHAQRWLRRATVADLAAVLEPELVAARLPARRSARPFRSPYYWAGFQLVGAAAEG